MQSCLRVVRSLLVRAKRRILRHARALGRLGGVDIALDGPAGMWTPTLAAVAAALPPRGRCSRLGTARRRSGVRGGGALHERIDEERERDAPRRLGGRRLIT